MTTPSECFKKQVKSNACKAFNIFIEGIILFLPIIVFVVYIFSLPSPNGYEEVINRINLIVLGFAGSAIIDFVYTYILAAPLLRCYFEVDI